MADQRMTLIHKNNHTNKKQDILRAVMKRNKYGTEYLPEKEEPTSITLNIPSEYGHLTNEKSSHIKFLLIQCA